MREVVGKKVLAGLSVPLKRLMSVKKASSDSFRHRPNLGTCQDWNHCSSCVRHKYLVTGSSAPPQENDPGELRPIHLGNTQGLVQLPSFG